MGVFDTIMYMMALHRHIDWQEWNKSDDFFPILSYIAMRGSSSLKEKGDKGMTGWSQLKTGT